MDESRMRVWVHGRISVVHGAWHGCVQVYGCMADLLHVPPFWHGCAVHGFRETQTVPSPTQSVCRGHEMVVVY